MKFHPAAIASSLQSKGLPIAKMTKRERVSGVEVKAIAGRIVFEWADYERKGNREQGQQQVIEALATMGLKAAEVRKTGIFQIYR